MITKRKTTVINRRVATNFSRKLTGVARNSPRLETLLREIGEDPLEEVEYDPDNLEASATAEMNEIGKKIAENKKAAQERYRLEHETDYWLALVFQSQDQRDEFLRLSGWGKPGERYLNGLDVARLIHIEVQPIELPLTPLRGKPNKFRREEVI